MPDEVTTTTKLHNVPEAMAALEAELTSAEQHLADLEKALVDALNPSNIAETPHVMAVLEQQRAPLAERIWMNVETVRRLRSHILNLTTRAEL